MNYENKLLLLFSATFSFMYDAKQNKTKQNKAKQSKKVPCGDFLTQVIVSNENFDDVKCENVLRMLVVWGVALGWLVGWLVSLCKLWH